MLTLKNQAVGPHISTDRTVRSGTSHIATDRTVRRTRHSSFIMSEGDKKLYHAPGVQRPTVETVRTISQRLGFDLSEQHLEQYTASLAEGLASYDRVYELVEPKPPVKYPRLPGHRPSQDDNPYNAWYMKTDISGAPSGKLLKKTVAVKDNVCVAGVPMMAGSKLLEGYTPEVDATVVTRVLDAGGHVTGKATCESLCISGSSFTNDTGPVPYPADKTRTTGGSTSGCAALLAAKLVDVAIGGDQGGSIRLPAAWCGVVGLKPTWGLVPYTGALSVEPTLDHLGPMAQNVTDCALLLEAMAGHDGFDPRQPPEFEVPEYSKLLSADLSGVRVGILVEGFTNCDEGIEDMVRVAAASLITAGATVCDVSIPMHADGQAIWTPLCTDGPYEALFSRAGSGPSGKGFHLTSMMTHLNQAFHTRRNELSPIAKLLCLTGEYLKQTTNYDFYAHASNLTMALTEAYDAVLKDYDVIVMPTAPVTAIKLPTAEMSKAENLSELIRMGSAGSVVQNTSPFNATGHPAISVNAGFVMSLPVGLQIVGKKWHDSDVLKVAYAWEVIRDTESQGHRK